MARRSRLPTVVRQCNKESTLANSRTPAEPFPAWETLEDLMEGELSAHAADPLQPDWYQDCEAYSLPKECMPNWRTVH
jgi:hypothetical protein